jgi:hypothetical protein
MSDLEQLNRAINRSLRILNGIAVSVSSSSLPDRDRALHEITQALAHVDALQRFVVASDPALEYHYDPNRPPSPTMKALADLVETAEAHVRQGNVSAAEEALRRAQEMEPPPLAYEMIAKRLASLRTGKHSR